MIVPAVSVVMPVRNARPWLDASIGSILGQTFADFELVIGDDGSTDGSTEALREHARRDPRIRLAEHRGPALGPAGSSDWVARLARAPLVARMDADDVSRPDRLERQVAAMRADPGLVMVGSLWEGIDPAGNVVHGRDRSTLLRRDARPFMHGSILYRRDVFDRIGGYRAGTDYWEDGDLAWRMAAAGKGGVLPEPLYRYRYSASSSRFAADRERVENALQVGARWGAARWSGGAGETGEEQLARWRREAAAGRIDPAIYMGFAYGRVWAGRRADILPRLLKRGDLRADRASARILLWALWASLAPRSLRALLAARMRRRDAAAADRIEDGRVYPWAPLG